MTLIQMLPRTFHAKEFEAGVFKLAGTLDGFIDFATPRGIYVMSLEWAQSLCDALQSSIADVKANCLYDKDVRLEPVDKIQPPEETTPNGQR